MAAEADADALRARLKNEGLGEIEVVYGAAGTVRVATHPEVDFVVSAIVGVAGLEATYEAVRAGKVLGLGEQGVSGRRRRTDHGRGASTRQAAASRSTASTMRCINACAAGAWTRSNVSG